MSWITIFLLVFTLATSRHDAQISGSQRRVAPKLQRLPVQKKDITLRAPSRYEKRILRYDPNTGETIYYDPKPQVVAVNVESGKYALKWIGYDGNEKTVIYQRPDAIDAIVSATVSRLTSGKFLYTYKIEVLPSSGQQLSDFLVQTFAPDAKPLTDHSGFVGPMSHNRTMSEGNWIFYGSSYFEPRVVPGRSVEVRLESSAPPGPVECSVTGGVFGTKGVGEDMPQELENVLPGYEIWPRCHTVGPVENLKSLSQNEHAKYLLERLSQFQRLGWMTRDARQTYTQSLQRNNLREVFNRAEQDLKNGSITSEVHDMIKTLLGR
jgi:hypothetical protein